MDYKGGDGASPHASPAVPHDCEDQMQLGIRIITSSFQNKVNSVEQEIRALRMTVEEQRSNVSGLTKKNSALEVDLVEAHQRSQQLVEENKELFRTVGALRKQISRLEVLRSAVMNSIQDDSHAQSELGDARALLSEDYLKAATPLTSAELEYARMPMAYDDPRALPSYGHPHMAATGMHGGAPMAAPAMVPREPAAVGGPAVIDGKQFFRQARSQLSYEAFNLFLASIKRMNNQQQTREDTLEEARRIFGPELQNLYQDFEALLNRSGM
eukprot:TRINITY_DN125124_c0_g1_i1.p1 TRINITY_DN125124_c0_g1~~TRINITY_DN125124_c0_g1_i1.p1  ORF type:complete len:270 (+),score=66.60 TRINITY_DN125124_c0_g1_i1:104-913(+)